MHETPTFKTITMLYAADVTIAVKVNYIQRVSLVYLLDVFFLVFISNCNISTSLFQFMLCDLAKGLKVSRKSQL